ncbi:hypothetical protein HNR77_000114 [Paenibacillus sp. JGP012]|nr:hypothetical protein [Paenibacillus sp. JGP012]MBB6019057.1 hypothetical protein [Paenibacillus sp. JGP012]
MNRKWDLVITSAIDAVTKTLDNRFDVLKTAKELNDKYSEIKEATKKD